MLKQNDNTYARIVKLLLCIKVYFKLTILYFHYMWIYACCVREIIVNSKNINLSIC